MMQFIYFSPKSCLPVEYVNYGRGDSHYILPVWSVALGILTTLLLLPVTLPPTTSVPASAPCGISRQPAFFAMTPVTVKYLFSINE